MTGEELTGRLMTALQGRPEVRLAFLFGSATTRGPDAARDVDVAIAFAQPVSLLWQCALCVQLEQIVGRQIDLVDLDSASTLLPAGVKLRNLVGHGYAEVDPAKMKAAAGELAALVDPFCSAILAFAESHPS